MVKPLSNTRGSTAITSVLILALGALLAWKSLEIGPLAIHNDFECESPNVKVRIVSYDPLVVHLEEFITAREREHLLDLASPNMRRAKVEFTNGSIQHTTIRTSSTALLNNTVADPIVQCLLGRLAEFQGYVPTSSIETLQVTAYEPGQHYGLHLDSLGNVSKISPDRWRRTTTSFGFLNATCDKCGTQFPKIKTNWTQDKSHPWCRILDCEEESLTVRPIPGSLLFWKNLHGDGTADLRTVHKGLPVTAGTKAGVNIWTKIDPVDSLVQPVSRSNAILFGSPP